MPGFKLKMIARGLGIDRTRRENLYALTYGLTEAFAQHRDLGRVAQEMVGLTRQSHELQFMCTSFDSVLKTYYSSPLAARATLVTALRQSIQSHAV